MKIARARLDRLGKRARLPVDLFKAETDALWAAGAAGRIDDDPGASAARKRVLIGALPGDWPSMPSQVPRRPKPHPRSQ